MVDEGKNNVEEQRAGASSPEKAQVDARIAPGAPVAGPSGKKPLSQGQRVGLAVVALAAVVLIAVSALFLFSPGGEGGASSLLQTTASSSSAASSSSTSSSAAPSASSASDGAQDGAAGSADGGSSESSRLVQSGTETVVTPGAGGQSAETPAPAPDRDVVTVTISVSSATVGNPVSAGPVRFTFERGATVLDALVATGLSVNASNSGFGSYVSAIGGLAEDPSKGAWGWKYSVNGVDPQQSSGLCKLEDGDVVEWRYVTDLDG